MTGLQILQNRGYDSAGIATCNNSKHLIRKYASNLKQKSIDKLSKDSEYFEGHKIGIGHTRWASHGAKTDKNAHPHICYRNKFILVHNGIIENYKKIKQFLISEGVKFKSETDTEVIINLISYYNFQENNTLTSIKRCLDILEGTWGLVIINIDEPDKLYAVRHGSPLLIGISDTFAIISSEQSGFCQYVNNYICLDNHDIAVLEKSENKINIICESKELRNVSVSVEKLTPEPFKHWTLKEIYEQSESVYRAYGLGSRINNNKVILGGLLEHRDSLMKLDNLLIIGCGTSYNAGDYCLNLFKKISGFNTVHLIQGGELRRYDIPKIGKTGCIYLSQSGETRDMINSLNLAKEMNLYNIGIVNVVDSYIAREVNCGVYLNAGKEMAVASTKAFSSQIIVLTLIAVWFAQERNINNNILNTIIKDLRKLPENIKECIQNTHSQMQQLSEKLINITNMFILGRGEFFAVANESALKIKELAYINTQGYSSLSLKHGPYAMLEDNDHIVFIINDDEYKAKNINIVEEVKSRNAIPIIITNCELDMDNCIIVKVPKNISFMGILDIIPLQLLAYELANIKNLDVDQPRNLAKSITID
jgi:glucosamine--fructose-6-phosphate aminotransferase (isomerizing)